MQDDSLVKYIDNENNLRIIAADTTITVDDARIRHRLFPIPAVALGRLLTGGLLMASTLKENAVVSLGVQGNGPLSSLICDASYEGYARGYCSNPQLDLPLEGEIIQIAPYIGDGQLSVRKMVDKDTKPYTGIVELYTSEIAEDLAYYYFYSEQIPTALSMGVYVGKDGRVAAAGGILVQALPPQKEEFLQKLETIFKRSPAVTDLIREGANAEGIVQSYLPGFSLEFMESRSPMFKCACNKSRSEKALITLGADELKSMQQEPDPVDITCEYCGQHYYFSDEDLQRLIDEIESGK